MKTNFFDFQFNEHSIRAFEKDGEYWFVAKDIASALGYTDPAAAASKLIIRNIDEFRDVQDEAFLPTAGGEQRVTILNEFGMWSFCMLAKTPLATEFRKFARQIIAEWRMSVTHGESVVVADEGVTSLVIPQSDEASNNTLPSLTLESIEDVLIVTLQQFKELRIKHEALEKQVMLWRGGERQLALPLLPGQKAAIRKAVYERMSWLTRNSYHTTFQKLYIALNRHFEVSSYKEIPSAKLDEAVAFVKAWRPPGTPLQEQQSLFVQ